MKEPTIRTAIPSDRPHLLQAVVELQDYERRLHATRLPGEEIADAYLDWMLKQAAEGGAVLVAEIDDAFAGFVAGWIEQQHNIAETPDSNRFGYISDICILPVYRGKRIANLLFAAFEQHLAQAGITYLWINVLAANTSARTSYERSGFGFYEVMYEKRLG
jgi:ribosomal protein S18 acetylase RimI-like enzyme